MTFLVQDPVGCKIVEVNKYLKEVRNYNYLSSEISYENEKSIQQNL
jgi:hypothetical protein